MLAPQYEPPSRVGRPIRARPDRGRRWLAVAALLTLVAGCRPAGPWDATRVRSLVMRSPALGGEARNVIVYLPRSYMGPDTTRRYPVLYFLHGAPGWCGDWFQPEHGSLERILDALAAAGRIPEVVAVAADGHGLGRKGRSLWIDDWDGRSRIESYFVHDVVAWTDRTLRTRPEASQRALVGISDGAGAAVNLLVRHPDVFGACAGLSGRYAPPGPAGLERVVGREPFRARRLRAASAFAALDSCGPALRARFVYADAGWADRTALDCVALRRRLVSLGVPHETHIYFGWHEWFWWRRRLEVALPAVTAGFRSGSRPPDSTGRSAYASRSSASGGPP